MIEVHMSDTSRSPALTLRQAAMTAGIAYLLMPVTIAEFYINPKLYVPGQIDQTVQNISAHGTLFVASILCYLITLLLDVVIAWALYYLLAPVSRPLSLLTAWFRLVYTIVALVALLKLPTVFRVLNTPVYLSAFGEAQRNAQVLLLLNEYRYEWSFSLMIFGVHLALLGYLIARSGYIPKLIGILIFIDGIVWLANPMQPYLYPDAHLGFLFVFSFCELLLPLWLVARGWKLGTVPAGVGTAALVGGA
jgi:hypothetical protein